MWKVMVRVDIYLDDKFVDYTDEEYTGIFYKTRQDAFTELMEAKKEGLEAWLKEV